jgi:hypothetical protein
MPTLIAVHVPAVTSRDLRAFSAGRASACRKLHARCKVCAMPLTEQTLRVAVRAIEGNRLRIGPIEAIDGTPVVDIKPVLK